MLYSKNRWIGWTSILAQLPALALTASLLSGCGAEEEAATDPNAQEQAIERHRSATEREASEAGAGR